MTPRRIATSVALVVIAFAVTVGLAGTDRARVADRAGMNEVSFGRPLNWVQQNFTALDPPSFPRTYGPGDPREMPTTFAPGQFLLTVVGITGIEAVLLLVVQVARRRRHSS